MDTQADIDTLRTYLERGNPSDEQEAWDALARLETALREFDAMLSEQGRDED